MNSHDEVVEGSNKLPLGVLELRSPAGVVLVEINRSTPGPERSSGRHSSATEYCAEPDSVVRSHATTSPPSSTRRPSASRSTADPMAARRSRHRSPNKFHAPHHYKRILTHGPRERPRHTRHDDRHAGWFDRRQAGSGGENECSPRPPSAESGVAARRGIVVERPLAAGLLGVGPREECGGLAIGIDAVVVEVVAQHLRSTARR